MLDAGGLPPLFILPGSLFLYFICNTLICYNNPRTSNRWAKYADLDSRQRSTKNVFKTLAVQQRGDLVFVLRFYHWKQSSNNSNEIHKSNKSSWDHLATPHDFFRSTLDCCACCKITLKWYLSVKMQQQGFLTKSLCEVNKNGFGPIFFSESRSYVRLEMKT